MTALAFAGMMLNGSYKATPSPGFGESLEIYYAFNSAITDESLWGPAHLWRAQRHLACVRHYRSSDDSSLRYFAGSHFSQPGEGKRFDLSRPPALPSHQR